MPDVFSDNCLMGRSVASRLQETIGRQLREARQALDKTQRDVATETEMNQAHISEIERGKINMTLATLCDLAAAVGCEPLVQLVPRASRTKRDRTSK